MFLFQLFLKGPRGARCRELFNDISYRGEFDTETIRSPFPTVDPSTNHVSNASNRIEGEANTLNSQFSMVMRDMDKRKQQINPELALSH